MSKEERAAAFTRLANKRTQKTLDQIRLIGNLASYPHESHHASKIVSVLRSAVDDLEYKLAGEKLKQETGFSVEEEDEI